MTRAFTLAFFLLAAPAFGQAPEVTGTLPEAGSIANLPDIGNGPYIDIHFTEDLDEATIDEATVRVFGRWSGPAAGDLTLIPEDAGGSTLRFEAAEPFFAGERVTVSLSNAIRASAAMGGERIAGYTVSFWVRSDPASVDLEEIGRLSTRRADETLNIVSYRAYGGDLNAGGTAATRAFVRAR